MAMTARPFRRQLIETLERARAGTTVVSYVTSTRDNLEAPMAMDALPIIHHHLRSLPTPPAETRLDLFLHSNGGDGTVPWRLVSLIREFAAHFSVLVPHHAFSAATLMALGADEVVMHEMGMLGPIDPTITTAFNPTNPLNPTQRLGISVEDVASYIALVKEDVGIRHEEGWSRLSRTPPRPGDRDRQRPSSSGSARSGIAWVVAHDGTVRAGATILQLAGGAGHRSQAGRRVELQLRLDGRLVVWDGEHILLSTPAPADPVQLRALAAARVEVGTPAPSLGSSAKPPPSHPWRRVPVGSKLYQQRLSGSPSRRADGITELRQQMPMADVYGSVSGSLLLASR